MASLDLRWEYLPKTHFQENDTKPFFFVKGKPTAVDSWFTSGRLLCDWSLNNALSKGCYMFHGRWDGQRDEGFIEGHREMTE